MAMQEDVATLAARRLREMQQPQAEQAIVQAAQVPQQAPGPWAIGGGGPQPAEVPRLLPSAQAEAPQPEHGSVVQFVEQVFQDTGVGDLPFANDVDLRLQKLQVSPGYKIFNYFRVESSGYILCALTLLRGLVTALEVFGYTHFWNPRDLSGSTVPNPFAPVVKVVLASVMVGDVLMAALGAYGIRQRRPKSVALLLCWRLLYLIFGTPMAAVGIYYSIPGWWKLLVFFIAFLAFAVDCFFLWVGFLVMELCVREKVPAEAERERKRKAQEAQRRWARDHNLHVPEEVPRLFGRLPLEDVVAAYTLAVTVLCGFALCRLCFLNRGSGGWALGTLVAMKIPTLTETWWLEVGVNIFGVAFGVVGFAAITAHRKARSSERWSKRRMAESLAQQQASARGMSALRRHGADVATVLQAQGEKWRATLTLIAFLVFSILRFALFIPITGVSLVVADICGTYVHGIASVTMELPLFSGIAPVHCSGKDGVVLLAIVLIVLLDAYILRGVTSLCSLYHSGAAVCSPFDVQDSWGVLPDDVLQALRNIESQTGGHAFFREAEPSPTSAVMASPQGPGMPPLGAPSPLHSAHHALSPAGESLPRSFPPSERTPAALMLPSVRTYGAVSQEALALQTPIVSGLMTGERGRPAATG